MFFLLYYIWENKMTSWNARARKMEVYKNIIYTLLLLGASYTLFCCLAQCACGFWWKMSKSILAPASFDLLRLGDAAFWLYRTASGKQLCRLISPMCLCLQIAFAWNGDKNWPIKLNKILISQISVTLLEWCLFLPMTLFQLLYMVVIKNISGYINKKAFFF